MSHMKSKKVTKQVVDRFRRFVSQANDLIKVEPKMDTIKTKLTPEQVENWRKVLSLYLGPYAFLIPVEDLEKHRTKLQSMLDKKPAEESK